MERRRDKFTLLHENRMAFVFAKNFDARANRFDDRRADKNHFDGRIAQFGAARVNVAGDLAAVSVAQHGNVEQPKRLLFRPMHFAREHDRAGARAEERAAILSRKLLQRVEETFFLHHFKMRGALATGKNYAFQPFQILRPSNKFPRLTKTLERLGVGFVVALNGDDADTRVVIRCHARTKFKSLEHSTEATERTDEGTENARPGSLRALIFQVFSVFSVKLLLVSLSAHYQPRVCIKSFSSIWRTSSPFIGSPRSLDASRTAFASL